MFYDVIEPSVDARAYFSVNSHAHHTHILLMLTLAALL